MATAVDAGLIPLYTTEFSTQLELLLQQKMSMLRGRVTEKFHTGKMASPVNQVGAVTARSPTGRFQPLQRTDAEYIRRWVFPNPKEIVQLVDTFDELQTIVQPQPALVETAAAAVGRAWDDEIIAQLPGTAQVGQDASALTAETFNTTNFQIAVTFGSGATASGLSVAKLIEARRILRHYHNEIETDPMTLVIGSQQEADLLNQVQIVSTEFNEAPVLVDGKVKRFLGFDIVVSERLPYSVGASNQRGVLAFMRSGGHLGMWKDLSNRISQRTDLSSQPWQIYTNTMFGATRLQLGKVIQILASDTTGGDITP